MSNEVNVSPEQMTVITSIQGMRAMIDSEYDAIKDFQELRVKGLETLRALQDEVIKHYNRKIKLGNG